MCLLGSRFSGHFPKCEALSGVSGTGEFRGTREQKSKTEGNKGNFGEQGTEKNQDFDFREQGKMLIFSGRASNVGITNWYSVASLYFEGTDISERRGPRFYHQT